MIIFKRNLFKNNFNKACKIFSNKTNVFCLLRFRVDHFFWGYRTLCKLMFRSFAFMALVSWCFPDLSCWVMIERLSCYQVTSMGENDDGTDWKVGIYLGMRHNNSFVLQFPAMIPPLLLLFAFLPPNIISARYGKKPEKVNFRVSKWKIVSCIRMQGKFYDFFALLFIGF